MGNIGCHAKTTSERLSTLSRAILNPRRAVDRWRELRRSWSEETNRQAKNEARVAGIARKSVASILDAYVTEPPSYDSAFKLFEGEWSSNIPGYRGGHAALFDDARIRWFAEQCGGFKGKRVLELGPLEGGHTSMIANAGAASVTAIECNTRAFLKCLIVQNALKFKADFLLGDFRLYLEKCNETFDVLIASGVLYHMLNPVSFLTNCARVSNRIALWTHYYDPEIIRANGHLREKFDPSPRIERIGSRQIILYRQNYFEALQWKGFCGGSAPASYWLTRDSLLGLLQDLGFTVVIGDDTKTHPNGPAMAVFASR